MEIGRVQAWAVGRMLENSLIQFLNGVDSRGEFRPRQTRQLPRAVDLKGRFLFLVVVKC
jgi:hypothetical protein